MAGTSKFMTTRTFLIIHSIIYTLFAVGLFATPALMLRMFGVEHDDPFIIFLVQDNSVFLAGIAVLGFLFRDVKECSSEARKIILVFLIMAILGFALTFYTLLNGGLSGPLGWTDACSFAVLIILASLQMVQNME